MDIICNNFIFKKTAIEGVFIINVKKYGDARGYFMETYKAEDFKKAGINNVFIQDNQSKSSKGVLRGLHYQKNFQQAKLVRCIKGSVFDVCVDLRKNSPTYGKWVSCVLTAEEGNQIFIPKGFAHGFVALSDETEFVYKCDEVYHPEEEGGIIYNDESINVAWPHFDEYILSEKDKKLPSLKDSNIEL